MGFLKRLLGTASPETAGGADPTTGPADDAQWRRSAEATFEAHADKHRVTIWLRLYDPSFETMREQQQVFALENRIMRALDEAGAGEHDTNSLEQGYLALRLVGEDAGAIAAVVEPLLAEAPAGSYLAVRHGPAGTGEERVEVGLGADPGPGSTLTR